MNAVSGSSGKASSIQVNWAEFMNTNKCSIDEIPPLAIDEQLRLRQTQTDASIASGQHHLPQIWMYPLSELSALR